MAKQKFTIAHDIRAGGKHIKAGSPIELDPTDDADAMSLNNLLANNRIVEVDAAHKSLADAALKSSAVAPATISSFHPPVESKPAPATPPPAAPAK